MVVVVVGSHTHTHIHIDIDTDTCNHRVGSDIDTDIRNFPRVLDIGTHTHTHTHTHIHIRNRNHRQESRRDNIQEEDNTFLQPDFQRDTVDQFLQKFRLEKIKT